MLIALPNLDGSFTCTLFLAYWDLDNWMLIGMGLILAGFIPVRKALLQETRHTGTISGE